MVSKPAARRRRAISRFPSSYGLYSSPLEALERTGIKPFWGSKNGHRLDAASGRAADGIFQEIARLKTPMVNADVALVAVRREFHAGIHTVGFCSWHQLASDGRTRVQNRAEAGGRDRRATDPAQRGGGGARCRHYGLALRKIKCSDDQDRQLNEFESAF